jgi:hypothetical protein
MQIRAASQRPNFFPRIVGVLVLALVAGTITLISHENVAHASVATFNKTSIVEAQEFASSAWHDPWDFSNPSDLRQDGGSIGNISHVAMAASVLSYNAGPKSWISLLWGGYPGSIRLGRDGALVSNQINAAGFTRIHIHAYSSRTTSASINYFTRDAYQGMGGVSFLLRAGWNDYDLSLRNTLPGRSAYAGRIQGLRLSTNASPAINVRLDFVRVYAPSAASTVRFTSPTGQLAHLYWSSTSSRPASQTATSGEVLNATGTAPLTAGSADGAPTVDLGGFPPGTQFYAVQTSDNTAVGASLSVTPRPNVIIDTPTAAGCGDWATEALGHKWMFTQRNQLAGLANATAVNFNGGVLTATNGGPVRNDPWVALPTGLGISGGTWHRLTIVEGYDGPFNLGAAAGGGTMGRLHWRIAGQSGLSQTNDLVTYAGRRTISIDLAMPTSLLTEPESSIRYPWAAATSVQAFRWDPNEDPGARTWHVYSVTLGRDCSTTSGFTLKWHDAAWVAGAQATVSVNVKGHSYTLAKMTENSGANSFVIRNTSVPVGTYRVVVTVQNPGATAATTADSTLAISH